MKRPGRDHKVRRQYLERYADRDLPAPPNNSGNWQQVLVIPAYREAPSLVDELLRFCSGSGTANTLFILVLNRPRQDPDRASNQALRTAIVGLPAAPQGLPGSLFELVNQCSLLLLDLEQLRGATPDSEGVGAARKAGFDTALAWIETGHINTGWICSSDADASLPADYFQRLPDPASSTAATFPFVHRAALDSAASHATALYELQLHYYVLGLEHAGSPYAFHTLGSCLAVTAQAYAQVRGFPRRAGAEDFYLLNKLAKLGPISKLTGSCIALESRVSNRVPFGTGPAVSRLLATADPRSAPLFYHPQLFEVLRVLLRVLPQLARPGAHTRTVLEHTGMAGPLVEATLAALDAMGWSRALQHCQQHGTDSTSFERHLHQWFDGFRTLKLLHALRDQCLPSLSLADSVTTTASLWPQPAGSSMDPGEMRIRCRRHWAWVVPAD